jgi:hypothetical protein
MQPSITSAKTHAVVRRRPACAACPVTTVIVHELIVTVVQRRPRCGGMRADSADIGPAATPVGVSVSSDGRTQVHCDVTLGNGGGKRFALAGSNPIAGASRSVNIHSRDRTPVWHLCAAVLLRVTSLRNERPTVCPAPDRDGHGLLRIHLLDDDPRRRGW